MSELDEPPAKVLKVDNIDGVTRVIELDQIPQEESMMEEGPIAEESRIVEGGADVLENDGQEEWLSEGILTDDDFNPGSQEEPGDRTDSQLDTSREEEHLDSTLDSETTVPDLEANAADMDTSIAKSDETFVENLENETILRDNEETKNNEPNALEKMVESQTYTQNSPFGMESETNTMESEANISENVANIINSGVLNTTETESKTVEQNIEETMKHLDGNKDDDLKSDVFDTLLIKKPDVETESIDVKAEIKEEEDDGNDTDDLLRMLGEDDTKTKKVLTKTVRDIRMAAVQQDDASTDDDDFVYEGNAAKKIKIAKNALSQKKPATKAEPEGMDDGDDETDASEDDTDALQKIFEVVKPNILTRRKQQLKPQPLPKPLPTASVVLRRLPPGTDVVNVVDKPPGLVVKTQDKPVRQYQNYRRIAAKPNRTPTPTQTPKASPKTTPPPTQKLKQTPTRTVTLRPRQTTKQVTTPTPKETPTPPQRQTPTPTPKRKQTLTPTSNQKQTLTPTPKQKQTPTPKQKQTPTPKQKQTPTPTPKQKQTPTPTPKQKQTPTPTPKQKQTPTPKQKQMPTPTPKQTQRMVIQPMLTLTPTPTSKSATIAKISSSSVEIKKELETNGTFKPPVVKTPAPFKPSVIRGPERKKPSNEKELKELDDIIDGEEFLDEDEFDLDEDEFEESEEEEDEEEEKSKGRQRIMRPEMMDEEVPSDDDSQSEDGSLYDELPSSESDEMEDWFTLDLRAEKAANYLPLLGSRAKEILLEEKERVLSRLTTLRENLMTVTHNGKKQAEQLREATISLAELDDMLKAS